MADAALADVASSSARGGDGANMTRKQRAYVAFVLLLGVVLVYAHQKVPNMNGHDITYMVFLLCAFALYPSASPQTRSVGTTRCEANLALPLHAATVAEPSASPQRMYYLDNLKVFMTVSVLYHHMAIGYGAAGSADGFLLGNFKNPFSVVNSLVVAINQSYFMCMFFFISGYFVPSSLARKGVREFLRDKFMRLGLPLLVYFFVFSPLITFFAALVVGPLEWDPKYGWPVGLGPPWFLQVLLLFSLAAALVFGVDGVPTVACPKPGLILQLGMAVGLLQSYFVIMGFTMFDIPLAFGALPFDILFFFAGCLAKKNKWLEAFQKDMTSFSSRDCRIVHIVAALSVTFLAVLFPFMYPQPYHPSLQSPSAESASAPSCVGLPYNDGSKCLTWGSLTVGLVSGIGFGLMTVSVSMVVLRWFSIHANFKNSMSIFLSEAAYGVYILHPCVWPVVSWTYVLILRAKGYHVVVDSRLVSTSDIGTVALMLGFAYTFVISNAILWPLAYFVRKLPGLRHVL
eukprot:TRINITY_DN5786_c0_g1_i1.p1 TRINITY_DN5786_c0_g1~~TRINITY_DN5786_c0_g1_i1.p1  ORF type:complete len:527 (+),score=82.87 TRINITY_DN5786_c0_g1_i1:38-1582(+)